MRETCTSGSVGALGGNPPGRVIGLAAGPRLIVRTTEVPR